jgi:hypothetical protein
MDNTTPKTHPAAPAIITALAILILAGSYLVLADYRGWWPYPALPTENPSTSIVYSNDQYGFQVKLPDSWQGYTVVAGTRDIFNIDSGDINGTAPTISIRHPLWTQAVPRQDIPVDIYTLAQWAGIISEKYAVSAAPIPPSELARNDKYVFALPARYNYAFPAGFEEVQAIIDSHAVTATGK